MAKRKKDTVEFRFYEIPQGEAALVLHGESWIRIYGHDDANYHLHFHNLFEIGICRYGSGEMRLDGERKNYETGAITLIPSNFPHITISEGEKENFWEYVFLDLKSVLQKLFPGDTIYQNEIIRAVNRQASILSKEEADNKELEVLLNAIVREAREQRVFHQKMKELLIEALVMQLIRREENLPEISQQKTKRSNMDLITDALEYVNKNYEQPIKMEELAVVCGMSETHFRRIFQEYINMSPLDYVNLIRIQKACEMMKKNNDSMDIIAQRCGFATTSTFNRNFKKYLDTSPYQWKINPDNYENKLLNFRISALKGW